jgi:two-component system sensor histidine kinase CpxA
VRRPPPDGAFVRLQHLQGRYVLQVPLALPEEGPGERTQLEAATPSLIGLLRFLGHYGWVGFTVLALLLSALLWWPFVLGITRRVGRLTSVTERISHGRFSERADPGRADELGRLATSVNLMAERLNTQVEAQRHFLLDASHELTSPLARVQVGLALVQEDLPPAVAERLAGVQADTQQMSTLLQDLLQFSRGERADVQPTLEPVPVDEVFAAVCALEDPAGLTRAPAAPGVAVLAERALLERALANLVRNALRYGAGSAITLSAEVHGTRVHLIVADRGPGVPADALPRLGEAFYRPDVARGRQTGGTGLGLAIVRRCVERLGGTVAFANRQGGGFEVRVELPAAGSAGGASPRE